MKESLYTFVRKDEKTPAAQLVKGFLWFLSLLYGVVAALRPAFFKLGVLSSVKLAKPVISVGNITTGGAGKTPFVAYLADHVSRKGRKAAILMRGYMSQKGCESDEARWYQERLKGTPVLVGENRAFEAQKFLNTGHCDIFIMDDGFQHLKIRRELDIVLIDATDPWGGGHLLPRGLLREGMSALSRADVLVITRSDQAALELGEIEKRLSLMNPRALIAQSVHQPVKMYEARTNKELALGELRGKKGIACCSIACPRAFESTLRQLKADIIASFHFMDHHMYSSQDINQIVRAAQESGVELVLTTEKDLVKLQEFFPELPESLKLMVLRIEIAVTKNEHELLKRIDHLLQR